MGYTLAFYCLRFETLRRVLEIGDPFLRDRIVRQVAESRSAGASGREAQQWRAELQNLGGGTLGQSLAKNEPLGDATLEATTVLALAFTSLVSAIGTPVGAMSHSSQAGDLFRNRFLGQEARNGLAIGLDLKLVVDRPMFGMFHPGYPSWGALSVNEVQNIVKERTADDLPYLEDAQMGAWLFDLWDILEMAGESQQDIITVYM